MSVNTLSLADLASGTPPLLPDETILAGPIPADVTLKVPATTHGPKRTEYMSGRIWVTDHRVLLISDISPRYGGGASSSGGSSSYDSAPKLSSVVVPYAALQSATFHLPLFSPNNMVLQFQPDPVMPLRQTGLPDPGRGGKIEARVIVGEGAGHALWKRIEGERERWVERRREENTLPSYSAGQKDGERRLL